MPERLEQLTAALAGRYEIKQELGSGGMATVYLAQDVKHHREVAIKVLRPDLAAALGSERFLREIRIAANLNHPHILALFDSGEADGFLYYVMPYIKGQTLRDRIDKEDKLPVNETVRIMREVLDALAFAHSEGVVHRDIKPDNIMLTGGHAVVADFGIAKAVSASTGGGYTTTAGVALGTPAYMAPEQATADPQIDHRADIYAVGALTYELLTGRPPFTGSTSQAVLTAQVMEDADPVRKHRDQVSAELEAVVMKCLAKIPADRWQTADEMLPYLDTMMTTSGGITPMPTTPIAPVAKRFSPAVVAIAGIAVIALGVILMKWLPSGTTPVSQSERRQLTFSGDIRQATIGPDGSSLAYTNRIGTLYVRDAGTDAGVLDRVPAGAFYPAWSPDGSTLMFQGDEFALYTVPRLSGQATKFLSPPSFSVYGYDPDGSYLIGSGSWIYWGTDPQSVDWNSSDPTSSATDGRMFPVADGVRLWLGGDRVSLSPNGKWIAYLGVREALDGVIGVLATDGSGGSLVVEGKPLFISGGGQLDWSAESDAVYYLASDGAITQAIRRVGIDPETGKSDGTDEMVFDGIQPFAFDVSPDGNAMAVVGGRSWYNVMVGTGSGETAVSMAPVTTGTAWTVSPRYSADGLRMVYSRFVGMGGENTIHLRTLESGAERVIRVRDGLPCCASWSPDERRLAYYTLGESGVATLTVLDLDTEATTAVGAGAWFSRINWTPDGGALIFNAAGWSAFRQVDLPSMAERTVEVDGITEVWDAVLSPNGQRLAFAGQTADGPLGIWTVSANGGAATNIRATGSAVLAWDDDGILIRNDDTILRIPSYGNSEAVFARSEQLASCSITGVSVAPSTGAFACSVNETSTDLWWVTGVGF